MKITIETDTGKTEVIECAAAQLLTMNTTNKDGDTGVCFIGTWTPEKVLFMIRQLQTDVVDGAYELLSEHFGIPHTVAAMVLDAIEDFEQQQQLDTKQKAAEILKVLEGMGLNGNTR